MDASSTDLEDARRVLLDAVGDAGQYGHLTRDPITGEMELVVAVRGDAARTVLLAIREALRASWADRLARSFFGA
jgi:hypothetical protein